MKTYSLKEQIGNTPSTSCRIRLTASQNRSIPAMAAAANTPPFSAPGGGRDEVYVATLPLRASKGPAQLFFSTAYSLNFWDLQHFMVIIKPSSPPHPHQLATVYDFQPEDPENIWVAAAALSRRKVAGVVRVRKVEKLPRRKCWYVGHAKGNVTEAVQRFNHSWETDLVLGSHDCRDYAQGLVEYLTGKKAVLEHLRDQKSLLIKYSFREECNSIA